MIDDTLDNTQSSPAPEPVDTQTESVDTQTEPASNQYSSPAPEQPSKYVDDEPAVPPTEPLNNKPIAQKLNEFRSQDPFKADLRQDPTSFFFDSEEGGLYKPVNPVNPVAPKKKPVRPLTLDELRAGILRYDVSNPENLSEQDKKDIYYIGQKYLRMKTPEKWRTRGREYDGTYMFGRAKATSDPIKLAKMIQDVVRKPKYYGVYQESVDNWNAFVGEGTHTAEEIYEYQRHTLAKIWDSEHPHAKKPNPFNGEGYTKRNKIPRSQSDLNYEFRGKLGHKMSNDTINNRLLQSMKPNAKAFIQNYLKWDDQPKRHELTTVVVGNDSDNGFLTNTINYAKDAMADLGWVDKRNPEHVAKSGMLTKDGLKVDYNKLSEADRKRVSLFLNRTRKIEPGNGIIGTIDEASEGLSNTVDSIGQSLIDVATRKVVEAKGFAHDFKFLSTDSLKLLGNVAYHLSPLSLQKYVTDATGLTEKFHLNKVYESIEFKNSKDTNHKIEMFNRGVARRNAINADFHKNWANNSYEDAHGFVDTSETFIRQAVVGAAKSAPYMALSVTGPVGFGIMTTSFYEDHYLGNIAAGATHENASKNAIASALVSASLEKVSMMIPMHAFKAGGGALTSKIIGKAANSAIGKVGAKYGMKALEKTGAKAGYRVITQLAKGGAGKVTGGAGKVIDGVVKGASKVKGGGGKVLKFIGDDIAQTRFLNNAVTNNMLTRGTVNVGGKLLKVGASGAVKAVGWTSTSGVRLGLKGAKTVAGSVAKHVAPGTAAEVGIEGAQRFVEELGRQLSIADPDSKIDYDKIAKASWQEMKNALPTALLMVGGGHYMGHFQRVKQTRAVENQASRLNIPVEQFKDIETKMNKDNRSSFEMDARQIKEANELYAERVKSSGKILKEGEVDTELMHQSILDAYGKSPAEVQAVRVKNVQRTLKLNESQYNDLETSLVNDNFDMPASSLGIADLNVVGEKYKAIVDAKKASEPKTEQKTEQTKPSDPKMHEITSNIDMDALKEAVKTVTMDVLVGQKRLKQLHKFKMDDAQILGTVDELQQMGFDIKAISEAQFQDALNHYEVHKAMKKLTDQPTKLSVFIKHYIEEAQHHENATRLGELGILSQSDVEKYHTRTNADAELENDQKQGQQVLQHRMREANNIIRKHVPDDAQYNEILNDEDFQNQIEHAIIDGKSDAELSAIISKRVGKKAKSAKEDTKTDEKSKSEQDSHVKAVEESFNENAKQRAVREQQLHPAKFDHTMKNGMYTSKSFESIFDYLKNNEELDVDGLLTDEQVQAGIDASLRLIELNARHSGMKAELIDSLISHFDQSIRTEAMLKEHLNAINDGIINHNNPMKSPLIMDDTVDQLIKADLADDYKELGVEILTSNKAELDAKLEELVEQKQELSKIEGGVTEEQYAELLDNQTKQNVLKAVGTLADGTAVDPSNTIGIRHINTQLVDVLIKEQSKANERRIDLTKSKQILMNSIVGTKALEHANDKKSFINKAVDYIKLTSSKILALDSRLHDQTRYTTDPIAKEASNELLGELITEYNAADQQYLRTTDQLKHYFQEVVGGKEQVSELIAYLAKVDPKLEKVLDTKKFSEYGNYKMNPGQLLHAYALLSEAFNKVADGKAEIGNEIAHAQAVKLYDTKAESHFLELHDIINESEVGKQMKQAYEAVQASMALTDQALTENKTDIKVLKINGHYDLTEFKNRRESSFRSLRFDQVRGKKVATLDLTRNLFDVFAHKQDLYVSYLTNNQLSLNWMPLFKDADVRNKIVQQDGVEVYNDLIKHLEAVLNKKDISGGKDKSLAMARDFAYSTSMLLNLPVAAAQLSSVGNGHLVRKQVSVARDFNNLDQKHQQKIRDKVIEVQKEMADIRMHRGHNESTASILSRQEQNALFRVYTEWGSMPNRIMDKTAIELAGKFAGGHEYAQNMAATKYMSQLTEALANKDNKLADEIVDKMARDAAVNSWSEVTSTQQSARPHNKSIAQLEHGIFGYIQTMFTSTLRQMLAYEVAAAREAFATKDGAAITHLAKVMVINHVVASGLYTLIRAGVGMLLGEDKDADELVQGLFYNMIVGPLGGSVLFNLVGGQVAKTYNKSLNKINDNLGFSKTFKSKVPAYEHRSVIVGKMAAITNLFDVVFGLPDDGKKGTRTDAAIKLFSGLSPAVRDIDKINFNYDTYTGSDYREKKKRSKKLKIAKRARIKREAEEAEEAAAKK